MIPCVDEALPGIPRGYVADISGLWYFWKPGHLKGKYVSKELAIGQLQTPSYTPFVVSDLSADHWSMPKSERKAAIGRRGHAVERRRRLKPKIPRPTHGRYIDRCTFPHLIS